MIEFFDTHCHIHFPDYGLDPDDVRSEAAAQGVTQLMCVGCTLADSAAAVAYAARHDSVWASVGLHPHEAKHYVHDHRKLQQFRDLATQPKVKAIGEAGLDYYYGHSPKEDQNKMLRFQLDVAQEHSLPMIFHVRDAFGDFWPILDDYPDIQGVVHSFTATKSELQEILSRNLYVGLNGIMTFTKDEAQLDAARWVPLERLVLETDAPFLTPVPFRGRICEPKHVVETGKFLAKLRGEELADFAARTTENARKLFKIKDN